MHFYCFDDRDHVATFMCKQCDKNLCRICFKSLHSDHIFSRLPIFPGQVECASHPDELAEFVCKELACQNEPTCALCHENGNHVGHDNKDLEQEYKDVLRVFTNCIKEIDIKIYICKEYCYKYDRWISTYSIIGTRFINTERNKKNQTLTASEKVVNEKKQIETWKSLKNEYEQDMRDLNLMKKAIEGKYDVEKSLIIRRSGQVELIMQRLDRKIENPVGLVMPKCYNLIFPAIRPVYTHLRKAVYFANIDFEKVFNTIRKEIRDVDKRPDGKLYRIEDSDSSILCLNEEPNDATVNLSVYRYVAVMYFWSDTEKNCKKFKKLLQFNWWDKILVIIHDWGYEVESPFENRIRKNAETDKRLVIIKEERHWLVRKLLEI